MSVFRGGLYLLLLSVVTISGEFAPKSDTDQDLPRYVVFPGVDADPEEIAEWNYGFATPFNVFFGPKPYVLGWLGEAPFDPEDEGEGEDDIDGEIEGEEGEVGEEVEEGEEGEDFEEGDPDYDYEKA